MPHDGLTGRSKRAHNQPSACRNAGAAEVTVMSKRDPEWEPVVGTPQAVANPGGMLQPEADRPAANDRLDQLPDFENDELRGVSQESGAGVLSEGGTARETGQASGTDRPAGEDLDSPAAGQAILPLPLVGEEERNGNMG